jgi:hypothetical protein
MGIDVTGRDVTESPPQTAFTTEHPKTINIVEKNEK